MYSVGKVPGAFWLGWDTGREAAIVVPSAVVARRCGVTVQAGYLLVSEGLSLVFGHRTTDICSCEILWCMSASGLAWTKGASICSLGKADHSLLTTKLAPKLHRVLCTTFNAFPPEWARLIEVGLTER
jgi:hypothetical protein